MTNVIAKNESQAETNTELPTIWTEEAKHALAQILNGAKRIKEFTPAERLADFFRTLMRREGFDAKTADAELAFIGNMSRPEYLAARRTGLASIGDRQARHRVFSILENAKKHASCTYFALKN